MKAAALRGALSDRARERPHPRRHGAGRRRHAVDQGAPVSGCDGLSERRHVLVVVERDDDVAWKSLRNVPTVHLVAPDQLNTYDVLVTDDVVFTQAALDAFLAGPRARQVGQGCRHRVEASAASQTEEATA